LDAVAGRVDGYGAAGATGGVFPEADCGGLGVVRGTVGLVDGCDGAGGWVD
jgi:hypothetical protein